jgi:hypothetical protein
MRRVWNYFLAAAVLGVVLFPFSGCSKKSTGGGDASAASATASEAPADSSTASAVDAAVADLGDARAPVRFVPPPPKADPPACVQARALKKAGAAEWQKMAAQCTAQGGKL